MPGCRLGEYPRLVGTGLLAMFGNVNAAIPFLLDMERIPADTFRLFVTSAIVNARFGTLLAAVHTLAVAVLGTCAKSPARYVQRPKAAPFRDCHDAVDCGSGRGTACTAAAGLSWGSPTTKDLMLTGMGLSRDRGSCRTVLPSHHRHATLRAVTTSVLDRVRDRGVLRVGYFEDSLPYAFVNRRNELVGFDVGRLACNELAISKCEPNWCLSIVLRLTKDSTPRSATS